MDEDNFYYFVLHNTSKDTREIELTKVQDGERYELFKSSDTPSGLYNPLDAQNISIKLKSNDSNPDAMDILIQAGGTELINVTDIKPFIAGSISLETCNSIAEFDNIKVTSLNDKKSVLFEEKFNTYPDYVFPETQEEKDILYDANGNMVKIKNKTIRYDYDNRPEKIITDKDTDTEVKTVFEYDYTGQRVFKKVKEEDETYYIGNLYEEHIAAEKDTTLTKYIYANGQKIASVVSEYEGKPKKNNPPLQTTTYYFHNDHLGGSNVVTDSEGNQVQLVEYLPYGEAKKNIGTFDTAYKFTGKELDDSSGLYYYGARYYSPELGRFISPDTIVQAPYDPQALNRYAYCRNSPLIYTDPSGHFPMIFAAMLLGGTFNAMMQADNIHNFGDFASAFGIGMAQGALTYVTGGSGVAGMNRVISQGFTSMTLNTVDNATGVFSRNGGWGMASYMFASAFMQGAMEHGIYSDQTNAAIEMPTEEQFAKMKDNPGKYIQDLGLQETKVSGRTILKTDKIPIENWRHVMEDGKIRGIVAEVRGFVKSGKWSPVAHTASATSHAGKSFVWMFGTSGTCQQEVAYAFAKSGLNVSPTQLFGTWDSYLTTGIYGATGGTMALPSFIGVNYMGYGNLQN